jgi:hypothetical protein
MGRIAKARGDSRQKRDETAGDGGNTVQLMSLLR